MKNKNVPELRFPEFHGDGEWEEKKFYDVASKKKWSFTGGPFGSNLKSSDFVTNGVRVIQLQNIGDGNFINEYKIYTTEKKANELLSCNIYPDDIILSKMGDPVGRACLIPHYHLRYVMCSDGIRLHVDAEKFVNYFIYSLINYKTFRALVDKTATGSTRKRIGLEDLKNLPVVVPTKPEQQKIADCLSSLDDLIHAQTQKVEKLTAHKKGLLQKLFPQEGQSVPEFRFPEFKGCGEWEEVTLGENTIKIGSGITPRGGEKNYKKEGLPFVRSQNIGWGELLLEDIVYITDEIHSTFSSTEIFANDVLLNITGASIGRCSLASNQIAGGNVNQHVCIIRVKEDVLHSNFTMQYIISEKGQKQIDSFQAGGNRQGLNFAQIRSLKLPLPSFDEQQKIADCLASLDALLENHKQKLNLLQRHKQGLMQGLFPKN